MKRLGDLRRCLLLAFCGFALTGCEARYQKSGAGHFYITPLNGDQVTPKGIYNGIYRLFKGSESCSSPSDCLDAPTFRRIYRQSLQFEQDIRQTLDRRIRSNPAIPYTYDHYQTSKLDIYRVRFLSLFQRPGIHASNAVHAYYVVPRMYESCRDDFKIPTVTVVHDLSGEIEAQVDLSSVIANMDGRLAFFVVYLPHYGKRKNHPDDVFLDRNIETLRENSKQAILDIHLAKDFLVNNTQLTFAHPRKSYLLGFSLGGIISSLSAGIDPGHFQAYSLYVGGGDLGGTLARLIESGQEASDDEEVINVINRFADGGVDIEEARLGYAPYDPITWAHRLKGNRVFMLNASKDTLIDPERSVMPLANEFRRHNQFRIKWNGFKHNPKDENPLKKLLEIVLPIKSFFNQGNPRPPQSCQELDDFEQEYSHIFSR